MDSKGEPKFELVDPWADGPEEPTDWDAELVEAGCNVIRENPGIDCGEWINELLRQYPAEVVDALGSNPPEVFAALTDWWEHKEYTDPETGEWHTLREWSEFYATDPDCLRERLEAANDRIGELEKELSEARCVILEMRRMICLPESAEFRKQAEAK